MGNWWFKNPMLHGFAETNIDKELLPGAMVLINCLGQWGQGNARGKEPMKFPGVNGDKQLLEVMVSVVW